MLIFKWVATKEKGVNRLLANPLNLLWLGDKDLNLDSRSQSPLSYH